MTDVEVHLADPAALTYEGAEVEVRDGSTFIKLAGYPGAARITVSRNFSADAQGLELSLLAAVVTLLTTIFFYRRSPV